MINLYSFHVLFYGNLCLFNLKTIKVDALDKAAKKKYLEAYAKQNWSAS